MIDNDEFVDNEFKINVNPVVVDELNELQPFIFKLLIHVTY